MRDVVLVTDHRPLMSEMKVELEPLLGEFLRRGVKARLAAWDDPAVDWSQVETPVLRTPWNYHRHIDPFLDWVQRVPRLQNPPGVVLWNAHKSYLRELEQRGVPVVPTEWMSREVPLDEVLKRRGWKEAVVKPAVSAGAFRTKRFALGAEPQALLREILVEGEAMLQPYLPSVEAHGERSLIYFGGELSHAVRRKPPLTTLEHGAELAEASAEELELAKQVLGTQPEVLYARVDIARDAKGALCLMELELIEPSFFLDVAPQAAARFVDAVLR